MAWPCYMVEYIPAAGHNGFWRELTPGCKPAAECRAADYPLRWADIRPGAMWWDDDELVVKLPGGDSDGWNIDRGRKINASRDARNAGAERLPQWTRTGDVPRVTASPSINWVGHYHGWLQDGVLTDDCEGRNFALSQSSS